MSEPHLVMNKMEKKS